MNRHRADAEKKTAIARRTFLRLGGAGLVSISAPPLWANWADAVRGQTRKPPANPVLLRTRQLEVVLDRNDGLPFEYRLLPGTERFRGEDQGTPVGITFCDRARWHFESAPVAPLRVNIAPTRAEFSFHVASNGNPAIEFAVRYSLEGPTLFVTLEEVKELNGFELIEVALPHLATVREEDGASWLAHGDEAGNLALLKDAIPGELKPNTFWGRVLASMPVVMIGTERALCVQETTAYMDATTLEVRGQNGGRRASLGTLQTYRVNGSLCYDMNTGSGTPRNCGDAKTPNLLIGQKSSCRLDFLLPASGASAVSWLDGAKLVRARMPKIPTHYYDDKFVYGIRCDEPRFPKPSATFDESEAIIRDVAMLTDGAPQVAHLRGWQYRGKDTGYPAVAEVNARAGGSDRLVRLLDSGSKYNCRVTFSDNYDDGYRSSPAWDPAIVARRPDGELWLSRNWTGEDSYVLGLAKYMAGPGSERVRFTCQHYRLKDTIHVDVLSYFPVRNDWDRERPASGIKNLIAGRYKVFDEFKKQGLDVSSEAMRYAFIGKISMFWHIATPHACPFGGKPIPLQPLVYRKSANWGEGGSSSTLAERMLNILFYNSAGHATIRRDTDVRDITDLFYLMILPWRRVHALDIASFVRDGDRTRIGLERDSHIDLDWSAKTYSVVHENTEIARDLGTFCPLDDARIAFYAATERELSAALPKGWNGKDIRAFALATDGANETAVRADGGRISLTVRARQPVIVYRDAAAARKRYQEPAS